MNIRCLFKDQGSSSVVLKYKNLCAKCLGRTFGISRPSTADLIIINYKSLGSGLRLMKAKFSLTPLGKHSPLSGESRQIQILYPVLVGAPKVNNSKPNACSSGLH